MKLSTRYRKQKQAVCLVVSHKSKEALLHLFSLEAKYWNNKEKYVRTSCPDYQQLNQQILFALDRVYLHWIE